MNAAVGITKGSPLPGDHHVLRYVGGGLVDRETNRVHGSAFLPRRGEDDPSVNWLEYFSPPLDNQIRSIARDKRLKWGKTARLVRLNIGETIRTVTEVTDAQVVLSVIYDPLEADASRGFGPDPSHARLAGFPSVPPADMVGEAALLAIGFKIRDFAVVDMFEASAYA